MGRCNKKEIPLLIVYRNDPIHRTSFEHIRALTPPPHLIPTEILIAGNAGASSDGSENRPAASLIELWAFGSPPLLQRWHHALAVHPFDPAERSNSNLRASRHRMHAATALT